jgi:hypothetical protein
LAVNWQRRLESYMDQEAPLQELDVVEIPDGVAADARARRTGTIVWCMPRADVATVECQCLGDDPLKTVLIDVPVKDLRRI